MNKPSLTVLFITLNEEYHIGAAIDNVKDIAEKIYVVDSGSTDRTVAIAESKGAEVVYHKFENFGAQWNFALNLPITTDWTMKMDPDERLSENLKKELVETLAKSTSLEDGYSYDLILWFMGRPLKGVRMSVNRIWRTGGCRFTDISVNEHSLIDGKWIKLHGTADHLDSKDLTDWLSKQNRYTQKEAIQRVNGEKLPATPNLFGSGLERRMFLKWLLRRLPMKFLIIDLYFFFWCGAWRSGVLGWRWVKCREFVSRMSVYKYIELRDALHSLDKRALNCSWR